MSAPKEPEDDSGYKEKYEQLLVALNTLYGLNRQMDTCFGKIYDLTAGKEKEPRKKKYKRNDECLPALDADETEWVKNTQKDIKMLAENNGTLFNIILQKIYSKMRGVYGIVFEQVKKDFFEQNQIDEGTEITTLRLVTYHPELRSIFESILGTMEKETSNGKSV